MNESQRNAEGYLGSMGSTDTTKFLDEIIDQSHHILNMIQENRWDEFFELEGQRQKSIEEIKRLNLLKEASTIERFETIIGLNKSILDHSVDYQNSLKSELKKHYNKKNITKAYQQPSN